MPTPTYAQLLTQNRSYRLLWLGEVVSFFGDWFKTIALYAIARELSPDAGAVANVMVATLLPIFLVTPIAGSIADRFDRRTVMIVTDIARAIGAVLLVVAHRSGDLNAIYAVLVVMVGFSGIFIPARTASVPAVTSREELPAAMALSGGTWSVMLAIGAAAGGLVTQAVGADFALLLDGATYLGSAALLAQLPPLPPRAPTTDAPRTGFVDGLRYLGGHPYLASVLSLKTAIGLAGGAVVTIPLWGDGLFAHAHGPLYTGILYAARGTGALVGSMGVRRIFGDAPRTMHRLIAVGFTIKATAYLALGTLVSTMPQAALCFFCAAVGSGVVWVFSSTLGQLASAPEYRGRVFSLEFAGMTLSMAASSWIAGQLIDHTSLSANGVVAATGAVLLTPALIWLLALRRWPPTPAETAS